MEDKKIIKKPHNIIMENRKKLSVSGINDIGSFDEHSVVLHTDYGDITINGTNLHMNALSVETGETSMDGEINSIIYSRSSDKSGSFLSRIFK